MGAVGCMRWVCCLLETWKAEKFVHLENFLAITSALGCIYQAKRGKGK